jgi:hypothetical protein
MLDDLAGQPSAVNLSSRVAWTSVDTACMKAMYVARRFSMRLPT